MFVFLWKCYTISNMKKLKCIRIEESVWRKIKIDAAVKGASIGDYIKGLIEKAGGA